MKGLKKFVVGLLAVATMAFGAIGLASCGGVTVTPNNNGGVVITPNESAPNGNQGGGIQSGDSDSSVEHVHDWTKETVVTEVSCTVVGIKVLECECGEEKLETTQALGHERLRIFAKAPTCTEVGWETYETCEREGCDYTTYKEIEALGHDDTEYEGKAATCTEFGWEAYTVCERCHVSTYKKIEALGHDYIEGICDNCDLMDPDHEHIWDEGTTTLAAGCTKTGVKTYACTVGECKETIAEEIPALGHDSVKYGAKEPTCEDIGWNAYEICGRCSYSTYVELPAAGHSFDSGVVTTAATCEKDGVLTFTCFCYETYTEKIEAIGHSYGEWTLSKVAKCEENGEEKRVCANDATHVETRSTVKLGHNYGAWTTITDATCITAGQEKRVCANDNTHVETSVIPATGHTEVIDEAVAATYDNTGLTEGLHCSVCNTVLIEQQIIPVLEATYHSITYKNIKTAEYPTITSYTEHIGLIDLPEISVEGYNFLGWYTASIGGEIVDYIPEGSTKNYVLFAHWDAINYKITYNDAPISNNPDTYTVEDEITLNKPEWNGLSFAYWKDENGDNRTKIEQGTTGNIVLTAHWKQLENIAIPTNSSQMLTVFDEENFSYHFIYELGEIKNVLLEVIARTRKLSGEELQWNQSESITIEESIANSVAESVGKNISETNEWTNTIENLKSISSNQEWNGSFDFGVDILNMISTKIGFTFGASVGAESTLTQAQVKGGSESSESQFDNSFSSTVSFVNGTSKTVSESHTVASVMPEGWYTYAFVGEIKAYAIISYDAKTKNYYADTYSILKNDCGTAILYEVSNDTMQDVNIVENESLSCNVPVDEIETYINSSWYKVQYDANGGIGEMPTNVFYSGLPHTLYPNQFTRTGYTFVGWKLQDGTDIYAEKSKVSDLAAEGETVVLEAQWAVIEYKITCRSNDGTTRVCYEKEYTVEDEIIELEAAKRAYYEFKGWYTESDCKTKVQLLTLLEDPKDIVLYAGWEAISYTITYKANGGIISGTYTKTYTVESSAITLPSEIKRTGYKFEGWCTDSACSKTTSGAALLEEPRTIDLYAKWSIITYTITYNTNGGTIESSGYTKEYTVKNDIISLPTNVTRTRYTFKGWYTDSACTQAVNTATLLKNPKKITLYAKWDLLTYCEWSAGSVHVESKVGDQLIYCYVNDVFDISALSAAGYEFKATLNYTLRPVGDASTFFSFILIPGDDTVKLAEKSVGLKNGYHTLEYHTLMGTGNASDLLGKNICFMWRCVTSFLDPEDDFYIDSINIAIEFYK